MDSQNVVAIIAFAIIVFGYFWLSNKWEAWGKNRAELAGLDDDERAGLRPAEREFFARFGTTALVARAFEDVGVRAVSTRTVTENGEERQVESYSYPRVLGRVTEAQGVGVRLRLPVGMTTAQVQGAVDSMGELLDIDGVREYMVELVSPGQVRFFAVTRDAFEESLGVDFLD